jgi:MoaA/NifB/PqqE/SkfB family radical SAM enzyme
MTERTKKFQNTAFDVGIDCIVKMAPLLAKSPRMRHHFVQMGSRLSTKARPKGTLESDYYPGIQADKTAFGHAVLGTMDRILQRNLSSQTLSRLGHNLVHAEMINYGDRNIAGRFREQFGFKAPSFLTISPGKTCNLQCKGCYASAGPAAEKLTWSTFDRIITEAKELWGVKFFVISGGEPLAYKSEGKGILDAAEKHPDAFFMFYTNSTLITKDVAKRMAKLGNISPAISIEGWKEKTDDRRGAGVFDKIMEAMANLREAGVLFGVSLTATKLNAEEILSEEFINFLFEKQGACYGWIFQYMPIGRSYTLDLMPTPEQRLKMRERAWEIIKQHEIFLADFWNHGSVSNGCLAGGGINAGYLYIDWNGNVSPCVFVPYSPVNVNDIYTNGKNINDIWLNPFFKDIRDWQNKFMQGKGNWLAPCINRDHHEVLNRLVAQYEPDPIDESAAQALSDPQYQKGLEDYGKAYNQLTEKIWEKEYLPTAK